MAIRVGILGYGNLGRGVECAVKHNPDMELKAVFTRRNPDSLSILTEGAKVCRAEDVLSMKDQIDVMILCGGSATDLPGQTPEMAAHFNVIDSFDTHANIPRHFEAVDKAAKESGHVGIISVGWDPGMFSLNRLYANAILPGGSAISFFLAFSIPAGLGTAFLYPSIQSCAQKWYAGRKGLATGVIGGAVGLSGAFLTVFVRTAVSGFGIVQGIRGAFWALGAVTLPVCLAGSLLLQDPPQDAEKQQQNDKNTIDLSPWQMLKTKQYWLCAGAVCFSTPAVLLFSPIILKLGVERGLDESAALWSVVLGSVGSAAGRLLMPMLSDKIGRRPTDLLLFAVSLGLSAGFAFAQGWWVIACYAGLTFCYSGLAAVLPALSTDLFGLPHAGVNYGFLALGQSVGSLAFPFAANLWGLEAGRHWLAVGGAAAGFAAMWVLKPAGQTPRRQDTGA
mgnify:CR=1 FL=1